jgi:hypothetical protein
MIAAVRGIVFGCLILLTMSGLQANEIAGTVTEVSGDVATITVTGEQTPCAGDLVKVFDRVEGVANEVLVGRGKVTEVRDGSVLAKIDARGKLAKGQTVRITVSQPPSHTEEPPNPPTVAPPTQVTSDVSGATAPRSARELSGKVAGINGPFITVAVEGETLPKPGDALEVLGEGPAGLTSIGTGRVIELRNRDVMGRVEKSTGTIRLYQLVRIQSQAPSACEIFAVESVWLSTLAGEKPNQATHSESHAEQLAWAERKPLPEIVTRLSERFAQQFDKQARQGNESARRFYAQASARLAAYGIDLGDRGSNLRGEEPHYSWAQRQTTAKLREAIVEKVIALLHNAH